MIEVRKIRRRKICSGVLHVVDERGARVGPRLLLGRGFWRRGRQQQQQQRDTYKAAIFAERNEPHECRLDPHQAKTAHKFLTLGGGGSALPLARLDEAW